MSDTCISTAKTLGTIADYAVSRLPGKTLPVPMIAWEVFKYRKRVLDRLKRIWATSHDSPPADDEILYLNRIAEMMRFDAIYAPSTLANFINLNKGGPMFPATPTNFRTLLCHLYNTYTIVPTFHVNQEHEDEKDPEDDTESAGNTTSTSDL